MKVKKKYDGGGMFETSRATKRKLRKAAKKSEKRKKRRQDIIDEGTPLEPSLHDGGPDPRQRCGPEEDGGGEEKEEEEGDQSARPSWRHLWYSPHAPACCGRFL